MRTLPLSILFFQPKLHSIVPNHLQIEINVLQMGKFCFKIKHLSDEGGYFKPPTGIAPAIQTRFYSNFIYSAFSD